MRPIRLRLILKRGCLSQDSQCSTLASLEVEALARHPHDNVADAGPAVEPGPQRVERQVVRGSRKPGEAECCLQESAALVEVTHVSPRLSSPGSSPSTCPSP